MRGKIKVVDGSCVKALQSLSFCRQSTLICPSEIETPTKSYRYWELSEVRVSQLVQESFGKNCESVSIVSSRGAIDTSSACCVHDGRMVLCVSQDAFESIGIDTFLTSSRAQLEKKLSCGKRYLEVDLIGTNVGCGKRKKPGQSTPAPKDEAIQRWRKRLATCFHSEKFNPISMIGVEGSAVGMEATVPIFVNALRGGGSEASARPVEVDTWTRNVDSIPTWDIKLEGLSKNVGALEDTLEWLGMCHLKMLPEGGESLWTRQDRGLIPNQHLVELYNSACSAVEKGEQPWALLTVWGVEDSPLSFDAAHHHDTSGGHLLHIIILPGRQITIQCTNALDDTK